MKAVRHYRRERIRFNFKKLSPGVPTRKKALPNLSTRPRLLRKGSKRQERIRDRKRSFRFLISKKVKRNRVLLKRKEKEPYKLRSARANF